MIKKVWKADIRPNKHRRLRHHLSGTAHCPRLAVFRSDKHMYAQIIDDTVGKDFSISFYSSERRKSRIRAYQRCKSSSISGNCNRKESSRSRYFPGCF